MKAKDRAKKQVAVLKVRKLVNCAKCYSGPSDDMGAYWAWDKLEELITEVIRCEDHRIVGECAEEALKYGYEVLAAKVFSQQIAERISSLVVCEEEETIE